MSPRLRYALFQVPAQAGVALLGFLLWRFADLPGWLAVGGPLLWVAKDLAMYPLLRRAYEPQPHGAAALIGRRAVVGRRLAPRGTVRFGAELWNAETRDGSTVEPGGEVRVVAARGMTLLVEK